MRRIAVVEATSTELWSDRLPHGALADTDWMHDEEWCSSRPWYHRAWLYVRERWLYRWVTTIHTYRVGSDGTTRYPDPRDGSLLRRFVDALSWLLCDQCRQKDNAPVWRGCDEGYVHVYNPKDHYCQHECEAGGLRYFFLGGYGGRSWGR